MRARRSDTPKTNRGKSWRVLHDVTRPGRFCVCNAPLPKHEQVAAFRTKPEANAELARLRREWGPVLNAREIEIVVDAGDLDIPWTGFVPPVCRLTGLELPGGRVLVPGRHGFPDSLWPSRDNDGRLQGGRSVIDVVEGGPTVAALVDVVRADLAESGRTYRLDSACTFHRVPLTTLDEVHAVLEAHPELAGEIADLVAAHERNAEFMAEFEEDEENNSELSEQEDASSGD